MAFAAPQPEFPRSFNEPRLSTVPSSPLYERRANRAAAIDHSPGASNNVNNHHPTGKMDLTEKIGALEIAQVPPNSALNMPAQRQVKELVHVIEAAEYAIRNQMEENEHLRSALRVTEWELQNSKMDQQGVPRPTDDQPHDPYQSRPGARRSGFDRGHFFPTSQAGGNREGYAVPGLQDEQGSIIVHPTAGQPQEYQNGGPRGPPLPGPHGHPVSAMNGTNGGSKNHHRGGLPHLPPIVDTNSSGVSSPSSRSMSPNARRRDAELETRAQGGGQALPQLPSDVNANHNLYQPPDLNDNHNVYHDQEVALRTTISQQEEITLLHKRLTEASIKEAQVQSEKRILERRVAELRLAYDQQQQGLVDAASKALSYRQEVLEENIRLTYALQAADTERSVYISNLLPLLAEFDLQPTVTDAHSMVSAIKILVQHLRSELSLSEMQGKNKDALFRQNWRADLQYHNGGQYPQQSPPHGKLHGLEIVPQHFQPQMPASPPSPMRQPTTWSSGPSSQFPASGNERAQFGGSEPPPQSSPRPNHFPPTAFADQESHDNPDFERPPEFSEQDEASSNGPVGGLEETERSDPAPRSPRSPHMPTLPEETTSEDGDPLPAIQGLQIVGHAVLGGRLTACGHSINGTALCMFQWVRHLQNGTTMYIEGAAQPEYTVTADDCDTMIAIECVPMDERNRRGDLVTVFANESRWITCDAMMQDQIDSYSANGHVSFEVQFLVDGGPPEENWESVTLTLKRSSFELRRNTTTRRVVLSEKYSSDVSIKIPVGHLIQCVITSHERRLFYLEFRDSRTRDVGVLTFRLFQKTALDGKRGRRRGGIPWFS
ncbi:unnamed protein product [Calypogeia fissa]